jgi:excisionase family DNA binding protein
VTRGRRLINRRRTRQVRPKTTREPFNDLPTLRFSIPEAAHILRVSRALLYNRINEGTIQPHKDGTRTYIPRVELERYVESCALSSEIVPVRIKYARRLPEFRSD